MSPGGRRAGLLAADEPVAQLGDAGLDLLDARKGHLRPAAALAQLGVDDGVRLVAAARPRRDQAGKLLAQRGAALVVGDPGVLLALGARGTLALLLLDLLRLARSQEGVDLFGLQQAGDAEILLLLDQSG